MGLDISCPVDDCTRRGGRAAIASHVKRCQELHELEELRDEVDLYRRGEWEMDQLKFDHEALQQEYDELDEMFADLAAENESFEEEASKTEVQVEDLTTQLEASREKIKELEKQLNSSQKKLKAAQGNTSSPTSKWIGIGSLPEDFVGPLLRGEKRLAKAEGHLRSSKKVIKNLKRKLEKIEEEGGEEAEGQESDVGGAKLAKRVHFEGDAGKEVENLETPEKDGHGRKSPEL
ncbi:hypothetical protein P7C70_g8394, partial [Phenoliferia sp. Uapishka_3]